MKNYRPEAGIDFRFTHNDIEYGIGYQEADEAFALTKNSEGDWAWDLVESGIGSDLRDANEFLDMFLGKVNKKVFGGQEPQEPKNEFEKLLQITANGLQYTPTGIVRK